MPYFYSRLAPWTTLCSKASLSAPPHPPNTQTACERRSYTDSCLRHFANPQHTAELVPSRSLEPSPNRRGTAPRRWLTLQAGMCVTGDVGHGLGVILGSFLLLFWCRFWVMMGSFWDRFGIVLGLFWGRFGIGGGGGVVSKSPCFWHVLQLGVTHFSGPY